MTVRVFKRREINVDGITIELILTCRHNLRGHPQYRTGSQQLLLALRHGQFRLFLL